MSKKTPNSPLDLVTALMQERAKFETWLATLEAKRDATPEHVYDRVRRDYESRLGAVLDELKAHAVELEAQAERFTARLSELASQEQARGDARAEAELRAHVGELSPSEWEATAAEADQALSTLAAEQAVVGADLNRVHELLGAAMGDRVAASEPAESTKPADEPLPEMQSKAPIEMAPPVEPDPAPAADPVRAAETARPSAEQSRFDELAFLKSVVSPLGSRTPVEPARQPAKPAAQQLTQDTGDTLAESLMSRAGRPSQERAFIREDVESDAASGLVGQVHEPERLGDRPYAANVTGNNPIVLRPSGAVEQPKTLKCAECAAMNYPTEWYCERCGAELASL